MWAVMQLKAWLTYAGQWQLTGCQVCVLCAVILQVSWATWYSEPADISHQHLQCIDQGAQYYRCTFLSISLGSGDVIAAAPHSTGFLNYPVAVKASAIL